VIVHITELNNGIKRYVNSLDTTTNNIKAGEIESAGYTRMNTQTVKVWLDNEKYIECTPDHKFLTRDGDWVEAQHLKPNDSLMPLYLKDGGYKGHYTTVYEPATGKYKLVHKIVAEQFNLHKDGKVVHHSDFNSRNNNPENLDCSMDFWEHRKYHSDHISKVLNSPSQIKLRVASQKESGNFARIGRIGGLKSGKRLAEWVKKYGPVNKKPSQYINCCICDKKIKVSYYRKDTARHCGSATCKSQYHKQQKLSTVLYNDKSKSITEYMIYGAAIDAKSLRDVEKKLDITRNTLNKVLRVYNIEKAELIPAYKNHKVTNVEWNEHKIDTCDITVKDYHNFGTEAGVIIHNSTLAAEDIRFARTIERIQRVFISELTKIAIVHLYSQGFTDAELVDFELQLTSPSIIYEKQKVELLNEKYALANNLKELNMFSEQWIYENIFGISEDEWKQQRELVIEDLKERFRRKQIEDEGNDPKKTNMSFGTPHDIASMHIATKMSLPGMPTKNTPGPGRPKKYGTWGRHKDAFGRDPFGVKDTNKLYDLSTTTTPRGGSALSTEQTEFTAFIKQLPSTLKTTTILHESLHSEQQDNDFGTMLDESNLLND